MATDADDPTARPGATRRSGVSGAAANLRPEDFLTTADDGRRLTQTTVEMLRGLNRAALRSGRLSPLAYNVTVSHEHRFVWYRNAKVATRTLVGYFAQQDVPLGLEHPSQLRVPTGVFADYFSFGFVRDPVDRFVSAWRDKVVGQNHFGFDEATLARMQDLDAFVSWVAQKDLRAGATDRHLVHQTRAIDLSQVDYLGRLESFDTDFAEICRRIGIPALPAKPRNTSQGRVAPPAMTEETRERIRRLYALDHQILGY